MNQQEVGDRFMLAVTWLLPKVIIAVVIAALILSSTG